MMGFDLDLPTPKVALRPEAVYRQEISKQQAPEKRTLTIS
jgi:hypothetical protein